MEYLAHYGVKGMKWGKHKAKPLVKSVMGLARNEADARSAVGAARDNVDEYNSGSYKNTASVKRSVRRSQGIIRVDAARKKMAKSNSKIMRLGSLALQNALASERRRNQKEFKKAQKLKVGSNDSNYTWKTDAQGRDYVARKKKKG